MRQVDALCLLEGPSRTLDMHRAEAIPVAGIDVDILTGSGATSHAGRSVLEAGFSGQLFMKSARPANYVPHVAFLNASPFFYAPYGIFLSENGQCQQCYR